MHEADNVGTNYVRTPIDMPKTITIQETENNLSMANHLRQYLIKGRPLQVYQCLLNRPNIVDRKEKIVFAFGGESLETLDQPAVEDIKMTPAEVEVTNAPDIEIENIRREGLQYQNRMDPVMRAAWDRYQHKMFPKFLKEYACQLLDPMFLKILMSK